MQTSGKNSYQKLLYQISNQIFNLMGKLLVKEWDKRLLGLSQLPVKSVIDIGANEGQFARRIIKIFPHAHIYSFEPLNIPFQQLSQLANHHTQKITAFNLALGDSIQPVEIYSHLYFNPSSSILPTTQLCETVYPMVKKQEKILIEQSTLDEVFGDFSFPLPEPILIKLDVQGYENQVIKGGIATFKKSTACIVEVSLDQLYEGQAQFREIFSLLDNLGYAYAGNLDQVLGKDGHVRYFNAVFIKE
ncbi:FkbM family methyltransferase [Sphaerospermopsis sp. FACHB-1094]|jgi:FkbM family methyltransferase|uniref:FkbM family methyltransferase n=1 Tax=Sphaerospermopsis sp. FACHB-1094 TaxID=2692861 RepID=UPI001681D802|nr:FkbM family methyltransferase [Sphaerospermopsis sp. FACHB-1094]MBD2132714.1 FkbM family methyltransferase [Sphaerospermopsis sp. FACHB-1094]